MDPKLVTTAFTLDGYRIVRNLGVVRGITVRSRSIIGQYRRGDPDAVRREHFSPAGALRAGAPGGVPADDAACSRTRRQCGRRHAL